jgi:hypothetical protein
VATHPNFISRYSDHDGRRFQTNKERLACGCRKRGRLFHTVSSGTGTEPHSASAWLPRGTSATKITTLFILCNCVCVCVCVCVCECMSGFCNVCVWVGFVMCRCFGNMYAAHWLRFLLTWPRFFLPWLRFFRAFSSVVRQMPGQYSQRRGTARTLPHYLLFVLFGCYLCCSMYCFCVNVYFHRVTTQMQLINISYHIKAEKFILKILYLLSRHFT